MGEHVICGVNGTLHVQVLMMVGINPVSDALGRVNKLEVIPLEELGRPRIDVVVNCSGVFRDLFVNQMNLLDRAIKMAAEQDESEEMNFVRKHARVQVSPRHNFILIPIWKWCCRCPPNESLVYRGPTSIFVLWPFGL